MTTKQFMYVIQSQQTGGPGLYCVQTPGVTITLENWGYWDSRDYSITIKDITGSLTPNITIVAPAGGGIDGQPFISMPSSFEALVFKPLSGGNTYVVT